MGAHPGVPVDIVEEAAGLGAAALVGGHGYVHEVDAPFDVSGCGLGGTLTSTRGGNHRGGFGGGCCEGCCEDGGDEESAEGEYG